MTTSTTTTASTNKIVAYYRVSTKRQGITLKAQQAQVHRYAAEHGLEIIAEIEEKDSGRNDNRQGLMYALATARKNKAALVAAKADRITRDLPLATQLWFKSGVQITALDMLHVDTTNPMLFGVVFSAILGMADAETRRHSERQKDVNKVKKDNIAKYGYHTTKTGAKQYKLGRADATFTDDMRQAAAAARKATADNNPANLRAAQELTRYFAGQSKRNLSAAARHLNEMQLYTARGVFHDAKSVKLLIARYDI